jgi:hypothetical protein
MSKEKNDLVEGLEEATTVDATVETKEAKARKEQSAEDRETLVAGVEQLKAIGVSYRFAKVLTLAIDWNTPKEVVTTAKETLIAEFGTSEALKDYVDAEFQKEIQPWQGIAKLIPVLNNIKSFYARRENTGTSKKVKFVQASIGGVIYNVNQAYMAEITNLPNAEKKELLLAHPDTNSVDLIDEIL